MSLLMSLFKKKQNKSEQQIHFDEQKQNEIEGKKDQSNQQTDIKQEARTLFIKKFNLLIQRKVPINSIGKVAITDEMLHILPYAGKVVYQEGQLRDIFYSIKIYCRNEFQADMLQLAINNLVSDKNQELFDPVFFKKIYIEKNKSVFILSINEPIIMELMRSHLGYKNRLVKHQYYYQFMLEIANNEEKEQLKYSKEKSTTFHYKIQLDEMKMKINHYNIICERYLKKKQATDTFNNHVLSQLAELENYKALIDKSIPMLRACIILKKDTTNQKLYNKKKLFNALSENISLRFQKIKLKILTLDNIANIKASQTKLFHYLTEVRQLLIDIERCLVLPSLQDNPGQFYQNTMRLKGKLSDQFMLIERTSYPKSKTSTVASFSEPSVFSSLAMRPLALSPRLPAVIPSNNHDDHKTDHTVHFPRDLLVSKSSISTYSSSSSQQMVGANRNASFFDNRQLSQSVSVNSSLWLNNGRKPSQSMSVNNNNDIFLDQNDADDEVLSIPKPN